MTSPPKPRNRAVLLLGPTGSGKTPLGDHIAGQGLWGKRCLHFDFGAQLRQVVQRNQPDGVVTRNDLDFLRQVLQTGALLEDEHFPVAERILRSFLGENRADEETTVVLNGLPRHVGQALAIERLLEVVLVVELVCPAETVVERIGTNAGGDRAGRADDDLPAVVEKLRIYGERTRPLVDHYRKRGVRIEPIRVTPTSTADDVWQELRRRGGA